MKTLAEIVRELDALVSSNYYGEDFELVSAARAYHDALTEEERGWLAEALRRRVAGGCTLVDALLCGVIQSPACAPDLVAVLHAQDHTSPLTRALIQALARYPGDAAYAAVARFLDSDQEWEALASLAAMDFQRTLPYVSQSLRKLQFPDACLHILFDRKKVVGLAALVRDVQKWLAGESPQVRELFRQAVTVKKGAFNPFSEDELWALLEASG